MPGPDSRVPALALPKFGAVPALACFDASNPPALAPAGKAPGPSSWPPLAPAASLTFLGCAWVLDGLGAWVLGCLTAWGLGALGPWGCSGRRRVPQKRLGLPSGGAGPAATSHRQPAGVVPPGPHHTVITRTLLYSPSPTTLLKCLPFFSLFPNSCALSIPTFYPFVALVIRSSHPDSLSDPLVFCCALPARRATPANAPHCAPDSQTRRSLTSRLSAGLAPQHLCRHHL